MQRVPRGVGLPWKDLTLALEQKTTLVSSYNTDKDISALDVAAPPIVKQRDF